MPVHRGQTFCPPFCALGALHASPTRARDRSSGHTAAHHLQSTCQRTANVLVDQLQQFHYKRALNLNIDRFLSLLQSINCRYICGLFDPGQKIHHCPLPLPSPRAILESLPRKGKRMLSCCRSPQAYQLFFFLHLFNLLHVINSTAFLPGRICD